MTEEQQVEEMAKKLEHGIMLARKRMLHEKALHNQEVILGDSDGRIYSVPAKEIIANYKEYQ